MWLLTAAVPGAAGFWLGGRLARRCGVVTILIALGSLVAVASFEPVTSAFDDPYEDDDLGGIGYWVVVVWMLFWFGVCLMAGWLRTRRKVVKV